MLLVGQFLSLRSENASSLTPNSPWKTLAMRGPYCVREGAADQLTRLITVQEDPQMLADILH